jgi:O-antigen/teichoic acid export membrane protein
MSIKADVIHALRWTAAGRVAGQLGSWAITIYVIRILTPSDYGLMSMAAVLMGFATLVNELGVVPALVQARHVDDHLIRQLFGFVLVSNMLVFCLLLLLAPVLSGFFGEPRLTAVARVLAVTMLIGGVCAVPTALLERELQFKGLSLVEFSSMILGSATTLVLAIKGFGVWSLVLSNIVATTVKTIGVFAVSEFHLMPVFRFAGLRSIFVFGANITGQRILWYINTSADVALVGKLLGDHALGIYSVAFQLATLPVSKTFGIINRVAFPAYSRLQSDTRQAADYFLASVRLSWLVLCPLLWGMSSVSHEFVEVFMGQNWEDAGIVLTLVPLIVPFRVIFLLMGPFTDGLGRPDIGLRNLCTGSAFIPVSILVGTNWGLAGVCVALIIAYLIVVAISLRRSLILLELRPEALFRAVAPAAIAAGVMYASVLLVKAYVLADVAAISRLYASIASGAAVYAMMTFIINRGAIHQCLTLMRLRVSEL